MKAYFLDKNMRLVLVRDLKDGETMPENATDLPVTVPNGKQAHFVNGAWAVTDIVARALTSEELFEQLCNANRADLSSKLTLTLDKLKADIGNATDAAGTTSLNAILNQTNANINSNAAVYVKAIAKMMKANHLADIRDIRIILGLFAETDTVTD